MLVRRKKDQLLDFYYCILGLPMTITPCLLCSKCNVLCTVEELLIKMDRKLDEILSKLATNDTVPSQATAYKDTRESRNFMVNLQ